MAEFSLRVLADDTKRAFRDIERHTDRATMWAVREAGRKTKQQAKRNAPKLTGRLRSSIHSSKRLKREGTSWAVRVAPRGLEVHFYSGKAEAAHGYMRQAHEAIAPQLEAIARRAWERSSRGRR